MKKKIRVVVIFSFLVVGGIISIFIYKDSYSLVNGFMTKKQLREDYDFVWGFIENDYPYKNVCIRKGIDLASIKKEYKGKLFEVKNEYEYYVFYTSLFFNITDYAFMGHLGLMSGLEDLYDKLEITVENNNGLEYKDLSECPSIKEFYAKFLEQNNKAVENGNWYDVFKKYNIDAKKAADFISYGSESISRLVLDKDISDEVGYINFLSFQPVNKDARKKYYKKIKSILKGFENKKHLIIDLRENEGGYEKLWEKGFVRNIITKVSEFEMPFAVSLEDKYFQLSVKDYDFSKVSSYKIECSKYYRLANEDFKNLKFTEKNLADKKEFNSIMYECINIHPNKNSVRFKGKIWVLIGTKTASGAETFAFFMQNASLISDAYKIPVTVIGTPTRGVFKGYDRVYLKFPNSGLVFSSDLGYALNPDGSCITESGVKPDIESKRMDAMRKCLLLIEEEEENE